MFDSIAVIDAVQYSILGSGTTGPGIVPILMGSIPLILAVFATLVGLGIAIHYFRRFLDPDYVPPNTDTEISDEEWSKITAGKKFYSSMDEYFEDYPEERKRFGLKE